jgi:hypothetical protein
MRALQEVNKQKKTSLSTPAPPRVQIRHDNYNINPQSKLRPRAGVRGLDVLQKMKILMAFTQIFLGAIWSYYASINTLVMRTRAMSDAMQMEADLQRWATSKVSESELLEIFPENYSLRFGGESKNRNFRMMIEEIAVSSAPPIWPGVASILIGLAGVSSSFLDRRNKNAEQDAPSSVGQRS